MIATQSHLDHLAERIEVAYRRRHPIWAPLGLTPGVWLAAAGRLNDVAAIDPASPIDPELFVAVQDYRTFRRDPWRELAQEGAATRYRSAVRKIVKQLKAELEGELDWSKQLLESGRSLDELIAVVKTRVSPIAKLALCVRHDRDDLADQVRPAAEAQQRACPLYTFACRKLIPGLAVDAPEAPAVGGPGLVDQEHSFAWN